MLRSTHWMKNESTRLVLSQNQSLSLVHFNLLASVLLDIRNNILNWCKVAVAALDTPTPKQPQQITILIKDP